MSRTYHHSYRWGSLNRFAENPKNYRTGMCGCKDASEGHNNYSRLRVNKPLRRKDRAILRRMVRDTELYYEKVMPFIGTRRPHVYWW